MSSKKQYKDVYDRFEGTACKGSPFVLKALGINEICQNASGARCPELFINGASLKGCDVMHEYAVTQNMVEVAVREAAAAGSKKILEIRLVIGDLSSIIDESVSMYFDLLSEGTAAQGAKLIFRRMPAKLVCQACGKEYEKPRTGFDCPSCGGEGRLTDAGREFYIESMEVE